MNRGVELPVPPSDFWRGGRGWSLNQSLVANDVVSHAYEMNPPEKPRRRGLGEFPGWRSGTLPPNSMRTELLCL